MQKMTVNDIFWPVLASSRSGLFYAMYQRDSGDDFPWLEGISTYNLDTMYFASRSGGKIASPFVVRMYEAAVKAQVEDPVHSVVLLLSDIFAEQYAKNWKRLWNVYISEYSPLDNYNMSESETRSLGVISAKNTTNNETGSETDTRTLNTTETTTHGRTVDDESYHIGFNGTNPVLSDKDSSTEGGTTDVSNTGTDSHSISTTNGIIGSESDNRNETETVTHNRAGNIGVTTSQQMAKEEIELWKWKFFESVFKDIDEVIALDVYDPCKIYYDLTY